MLRQHTAGFLSAVALLSLAAGAGSAVAQNAAPAEDAAIDVRFPSIVICEDVQERQPVGAAESFSSDVGRLWCFTRVVGADYPTEFYHRWYVGDRMVDEIPIRVKGSSWRCWSRKTILPKWSGDCRVEIVSEEGDVLATQPFTLVATGE